MSYQANVLVSLLVFLLLPPGAGAAAAAGEDGSASCGAAGQDVCPAVSIEVQGSSMLQRAHRTTKTQQSVQQGRAGADWTQEEALQVMGKLHRVFEATKSVYNEWKAKYGEVECYNGFEESADDADAEPCDGLNGHVDSEPKDESLPNAAKFVRLGFHDCGRYTDGSGGCDGCLKFDDMFRKYNDLASGDKRNLNRKDPVAGTHNGLYLAADILEEIYTDPAFPARTQVMDASLKDTGKSRADLWAFAAMVASDYSMLENNLGCDGQSSCGHLYNEIDIPFECKITTSRRLVFKTGRRDCPEEDKVDASGSAQVRTMPFELPEGHRYRPYETTKPEDAPNPSGNASMVTDYMQRVFAFTKSETVAIMGAHSLGEMHGVNALWKYKWQWMQTKYLNNNYYRMLASRPGKFVMCTPWRAAGGPGGAMANNGWFLRPIRKTVSAGPYQWFHYYIRCPDCYKDSAGNWVNDEKRGTADFQDVKCCACHEQSPEEVDPVCWAPDMKLTKDETMIGTDMAMIYEFDSDPETGFVSGCPGLDPVSWQKDNIVHQAINGGMSVEMEKRINFYNTEPNCPKNSLKDEGANAKTMSELVEYYADHQNEWADDFNTAWEKMLSNGYSDGELRTSQADVLGIGHTFCDYEKRKMTCTLV
eukprot:CAMPEP_0178416952 /NCGR_PEP_ID=MMETSP0689_2-20121128/24328_1 /TAXON_ID=160604 /ORGANISM="Amphidinium massartii, Strain CS-259" /LENGTH=646 /DNA_ID=CAMNT_0020038311 /DNA_START=57 /DNA_END=1997 /DNA_ORIENTATION=-